MLSWRIGRRASSNVPAPQPAHGSSRNSSHACVHHVQRWLELTSVTRAAPVVTCTAGGLRKSSHAWPTSTATRTATTATAAATAPARRSARPILRRTGSVGARRARRRAATTTPAAPRTRRTPRIAPSVRRSPFERPGVGDDRAEQRPHRHRDGRDPGERERAHGLEPRAGDDEPDAERRERRQHAAARRRQRERHQREEEHGRRTRAHARDVLAASGEPQPQRQRDGQEQRQPVPVLHRLLEPRAAVGVRPEGGDHRPEQGPDDDGAEERGEGRRRRAHRAGRGGREPAEGEEREVGEPAVEDLPRAVALDRPQHAQALPGDERRERADEEERVAAGPRGRERAAQDRDPEHAERRQRHERHPRQPHRIGAAAGQHDQGDGDERDRQPRERGARDGLAPARQPAAHRATLAASPATTVRLTNP